MNMNKISYLVKDAFHTMKKDIKNELISLGTMVATMLLISVAYIMYANANVVIESNKDKSANILAYLEIGTTEDEAKKIGFQIEDIDGVSKTYYRSKEEGIKLAGNISSLLVEGYTQEELENIYQACYIISFDDASAVPAITSKLRNIEGIGNTEEDIRVDPSASKAIRDAKLAKVFSITGMILIVEFSIFLMINTTKLMMYAKRKEISIMKYVGARDNFIKAPFIIQGLVTAGISIMITMIVVSLVYPSFTSSTGQLGEGFKCVNFDMISNDLLVLLLIIGGIIGIGGSTASMNKYLDV